MGVAVGRLLRRSDFLRVAAARRKWAAPGLILQAAPTPEMPPSASDGDFVPEPALRVGFTASKKVGNAVARNRTRRRLRAAAAQILPEEAAAGNDFVLIARQETLRRPYGLLLQDLRTALKRVGAHRHAGGGNGSERRESGREMS